jgi:hypothetical protein
MSGPQQPDSAGDAEAPHEARSAWGDATASPLAFIQRHRLVLAVTAAVLAIWLVGAAVTRYTLAQMAFFAPIAVVVVGATIGVVMLWVKIVLQLRDERRARR